MVYYTYVIIFNIITFYYTRESVISIYRNVLKTGISFAWPDNTAAELSNLFNWNINIGPTLEIRKFGKLKPFLNSDDLNS